MGAMETGYQRGKIQEESMYYEHLKHDGTYPIIGVNTFRNPHGDGTVQTVELARSTEEEKQSQLSRLADFHARHAAEAPVQLNRLQQAVIDNRNVFAVLMDAVRVCSLGQITSEGQVTVGIIALSRLDVDGIEEPLLEGRARKVTVRAVDRSDRIYVAMLSRGYNGTMMTIHPHQFQRSDVLVGILSILYLVLIQIVGRS